LFYSTGALIENKPPPRPL